VTALRSGSIKTRRILKIGIKFANKTKIMFIAETIAMCEIF
jgi:hypothetical protein